MFLCELWQSTTQYRLNLERMEDGFSDDLKHQLHTTYKREYSMMNSLNLDPVCLYVEQYYSPLGRPAIHQAQIEIVNNGWQFSLEKFITMPRGAVSHSTVCV